ncbi:DUF4303 domain-containing protein [Halovulum sp. GXIMD14793]
MGRQCELGRSEVTFIALSKSIADASRAAFGRLLGTHRETFYYFTLVTSGEALVPCPSAWSEEALDRTCANDLTCSPKLPSF